MFDNDFLDLFALDLPDLAGCAPDLAQAVDFALPDPSDPLHPLHPAFPLGPTGGGWPRFWENIDDIIGAGFDVIKTIGETAKDIIDAIWNGVGGAVRWLYNWGVGIVDWLGRQLYSYFNWVGGFINSAATWTANRAWDAAYYVRDRAWDAARWVGDRVVDAANSIGNGIWAAAGWVGQAIVTQVGWLKDRVWDAATWVGARIDAAVGSIGSHIQSGLEWAGGQVWGAADWVKDRIWDAAKWTESAILPPIMGAAQSVADVFRDGLDSIRDGLTEVIATLGNALSLAIRWPWENVFEPYVDVVDRKLAIPGKLIRGEYANLLDLVDDVVDPAPVIIAGIAGAIILSMVISITTAGIMQVLVNPLAQPHVQDIQSRVGAQLLTVGTVQEALNRGFIDELTADDHLSRAGYSGPAKTALIQLRHVLPGPTDLIRFAVREVFNPQARAELDLDAEFPEDFATYAALLGIERSTAEDHWAAHWDLPSPTQGYEMLHRGLIDDAGLAALLKALDYAPVWRDKLQAISYSPITRVDLRRLYKANVITEDDVFQGYKALGYNDERARWLTDWTKQYYGSEEESQLDEYTEATASQIRLAYRRHVLTRDEAVDKLVDLGYSEDTADFLLAIDDVQLALNPTTDADVPVRDLTVSVIRSAYAEKLWTRERAQEELEILGYLPWAADLLLQLEDVAQQRELVGLAETVVRELYLADAISEAEAGSQLDELDVTSERRELLLQRWELQKAASPRRLTLSQLEKGRDKGILTNAEFLDRVRGIGYNDPDAEFILAIQ